MSSADFPCVASQANGQPSECAQDQAGQLVLVPLDLIDVPQDWREIDEHVVSELAESIREVGLLQPIGLWLRETGRYTLVFGRHRMLAVQSLGGTRILAQLLSIESEQHRQVMTDIENLRRAPLNPAERLLALKHWRDWYVTRHPDSVKHASRRNKEQAEARRQGKAPQPKSERFDQKAAAETRQDASTIRRQLAVAHRIGDEGLRALTRQGASFGDMKKLADLEDDEIRENAIALAGLGTPVDQAIAEATAPPGGTIGDVKAPQKPEAELSDDQWFDTYCKDFAKRLGDYARKKFKDDAILYRKVRPARDDFKNRTRTALAQSKKVGPGPLHYLLARVVNVDHPSAWLVCRTCTGTGLGPKANDCVECHGHGYSVQTVRNRKGARV